MTALLISVALLTGRSLREWTVVGQEWFGTHVLSRLKQRRTRESVGLEDDVDWTGEHSREQTVARKAPVPVIAERTGAAIEKRSAPVIPGDREADLNETEKTDVEIPVSTQVRRGKEEALAQEESSPQVVPVEVTMDRKAVEAEEDAIVEGLTQVEAAPPLEDDAAKTAETEVKTDASLPIEGELTSEAPPLRIVGPMR